MTYPNNAGFDDLADPFSGFTTSPYAAKEAEQPAPVAQPVAHQTTTAAETTDAIRAAQAEVATTNTRNAIAAIIGGAVAILTVVALMILGWSTMFFIDILGDPAANIR
ncbi:hypothetical protein [Corynebacterium aquilae]|uniref:Uncharacterized protein n=1 Tax=Corynebacterium aquilae DSM 44791 TaxID=1431546 RepID=A0A1L7CI26_9CORY|nr:hypothetical protein [Corynebacterium aquilae]APT85510.1 hypothetical protein CAQU_11140 [Corynebacterium aquilae DSM 44791]